MIGGLPSLGGTSAPSVRRPRIAITSAGRAWPTIITRARVEMGLAPAADLCEVWAAAAHLPSLSPGDLLTLDLGYEDSGVQRVFTGFIDGVMHTSRGVVRVTIVNASAALSRTKPVTSFEQRSAGDIARSLVDDVGAEAGTIERGETCAHVVCDGRASAYAIIAESALRSDLEAWISREGKVMFKSVGSARAVQTLGYGVDLVSACAWTRDPQPAGVRIIGEGAAGAHGADAAAWIVKDPASVSGEAGGAGPRFVRRDAAVRSAQGAATMAEAMASRAHRRQNAARFVAGGAPAIGPGDAFDVDQRKGPSAFGGAWIAERVRHEICGVRGFITTIEAVPIGGLSGLPGGLP